MRFGPSQFEDLLGTLCKLLQKGSVSEYQATFEKLMNCVVDVSEIHLITYYVSGLKPSLQRELLISKPTTLAEAFSLAKVYEARAEDNWGGVRTNRGYNRPYTSAAATLNPKPIQTIAPTTSQNLLLPSPSTNTLLLPTPNATLNPTSNVQFRRTSAVERRERLAKGLCFTCDQVNPKEEEPIIEVEMGKDLVESGDISILNSLVSHGNPRSLQMVGTI